MKEHSRSDGTAVARLEVTQALRAAGLCVLPVVAAVSVAIGLGDCIDSVRRHGEYFLQRGTEPPEGGQDVMLLFYYVE